MNINSHAVEHFLKLAARGEHGGYASGGEQRAYKLLRAVLRNCPGLDGTAIDGLADFARMAHAMPSSAEELVRTFILEPVGQEGGVS